HDLLVGDRGANFILPPLPNVALPQGRGWGTEFHHHVDPSGAAKSRIEIRETRVRCKQIDGAAPPRNAVQLAQKRRVIDARARRFSIPDSEVQVIEQYDTRSVEVEKLADAVVGAGLLIVADRNVSPPQPIAPAFAE